MGFVIIFFIQTYNFSPDKKNAYELSMVSNSDNNFDAQYGVPSMTSEHIPYIPLQFANRQEYVGYVTEIKAETTTSRSAQPILPDFMHDTPVELQQKVNFNKK